MFNQRFLNQTKVKDLETEARIFGVRLLIASAVVFVIFTVLVLKMAAMQIIEHEYYSDLAVQNRVKLSPIPSSRGLIYDRRGELLAENMPGYNLEITLDEVSDIEQSLKDLASLLEISDEKLEKYRQASARTPSFEPVALLTNMSSEDVAKFEVNRYLFTGVEVVARLQRHYAQGSLFAHVIGYVGRINEKELRRIGRTNYRGTTHIGKTGIEKQYENILHGKNGLRQREVNSKGRPLRIIAEDLPEDGDSLVLSVDSRLQKIAYEALEDYTGSVVVIDNRTGEVLAMVSKPSFDPNLFVSGISHKDYNELNSNKERPLYNRSIQGQYPPGSTIKPIAGLTGLHYGVTTAERKIFAGPFYQLPNSKRKYRDWKKEGHGWVDLDKAITQSSDVYFYDLATRLGIDKLHEIFTQFKIGETTGIDLPGEASGLMPSKKWKRGKLNQTWYPGETVIVGIGQGYMLATPLQLAVMTACIANRGQCYEPYLLKTRTGQGAQQLKRSQKSWSIDINGYYWPQVITPMVNVMHARNGTARSSGAGADYTIAGKTGTAQVFGLGEDEEYDAETLARKLHDHALFVAFAPAEDPEISIAVVVEHGGGGSKTAAPIARKVMDAWFNFEKANKAGKP